MFKKILIANRGEIAVRIIRACRDLSISPVAVYSAADRGSLAVKLADQAFDLGKSPANESYLVIEKIIAAAKDCAAEAIHPGYGFLAENPEFVRACDSSGIVFIGPSAESMALMGNKVASRKTVEQAGVRVVPGCSKPLASLQEATRLAGEIGYPVMLKASAGGGGKGMRLLRNESDLASRFETTRSEAASSFNDTDVYLERYIERPRHIEVQILGDRFGHIIHLGERECSIQRRHQKVVEESPSPRVTAEFREKLGKAAIKVAQSVSYHNAGTVEFLVDDSTDDPDPPFYFLEMNTRLQVEHPVTEMTTGIDLVKEQIFLASGQHLTWKQEDICLRGNSLECRVYAEDPENSFFPSPGKITTLFEPSGPGIRNDSGVYEGYEIPVHYDPLISKLVAHGRDRDEAIARMKRALGEYKVGGVRTTIPFFEALLSHPNFIDGKLHTHFIDEHGLAQSSRQPAGSDSLVAAIAAALFHLTETTVPSESSDHPRSLWKEYTRFMQRTGPR